MSSPHDAAAPRGRNRTDEMTEHDRHPAGKVTTAGLIRAAAVCAMVGGALYVLVQIAHPVVNLDLAGTAEWKVRELMKVGFAVLSLAGIAGMYLRQVNPMGILGLIGYVLLSFGFLVLMCLEVIGAVVVPSIAGTSPGYVTDVLAVANNGTAAGDIGLMQVVNLAAAAGYVGGGLVFGIALFRAKLLARWASVLLSVGAICTLLIPALPSVNQRLFAIPTGVALIGLGYSLWRKARTSPESQATPAPGPNLEPIAAS